MNCIYRGVGDKGVIFTMKLITYNIRGLGEGLRKERLGSWSVIKSQICYVYRRLN